MNRVALNIFGLNIYWYSICILIGIILASILIILEAKKHKIDKNTMSDLIFYTIIFGIIGARIYYVIFNLDYYLASPGEILKVYNGGLAIHGGIIAGIITVYIYCKKKKLNFLRILDICAPAVILAQAIGRWGNFFNQEAYGSLTTIDRLYALQVPRFIINNMIIEGEYYYPTFYFESIFCLIGFLILIIIRKTRKTNVGFLIGVYFIWYGIVRFFIEKLRIDSLMLFNLKMAQIVSIIGIVIGIILIIISFKKEKYYKE